MRDIFDDIFKGNPLDPTEAARRNMRPDLRKKFYRQATVADVSGQFQVLLDGRPVRTPARRALAAPSLGLAEAIAAEWNAQQDVIDPAVMPITRLANSIVDGVADQMPAVTDEIVKYLGSDFLFYRADGPAGLVQTQQHHWDPVIAWARDALGARFILAEGVVFVRQPDEAVAAARRGIPASPWPLGAAHSVTTLTGSPLLALALAFGHLNAEQVWTAAHVDEDWNMSTWGRDEAALERRAFRRREFEAAALILRAEGLAGEGAAS